MKYSKNFFLLITFSLVLIIKKTSSILLFTETSKLYYNKPKTYELNLKDILKNNGDSILGSIIFISVYNENEKSTKIRLLTQLNSMPTINSNDHSDFSGVNGIYSISYSPCEFNYISDKLYIKIFSEKDFDVSYKIEVNTLDNSIFESLCTIGQKDEMSKSILYPGMTQTIKGVVKFGGQNIENKKIINDLFILSENKTWYKVDISIEEEVPNPRYGMGIISFDGGSYFLIYGGKNENDKYEDDLWVFDVEKETWHFIGKSKDIINFPINSFLPTLSLIENKGIILSFGNTDILYDNIYTIDIYVLKQILQTEESSKKEKLLSNLINIYPTKGIISLRYGLSIGQINDNEILLFGGYDTKTNNLTNKCEILNLDQLNNIDKSITDCSKDNSPLPRAFHSTIQYGPTFL